jgi:imidazolonepropionase
MWDAIWTNARIATMEGGAAGTIERGALATQGGRIAWVGPMAALPEAPPAPRVHDCGGRWMTPGLVDCHTHLVHGGDRAREFAMRLAGASYEEIARAGGGIVATVTATRAADEERLLAAARPRLAALAAEGVTTIEIKSGYGLSVEDEARMLRVAGRLGAEQRLRVVRTFLGAHAVPPEFRGRQGEYVDLVCSAMLERVAGEGLADAVDAFGERIAFTPAEVGRVFEAAQARGLPVKLHADQLSDQGGAALAARFGALSADHLEYSSEAGIAAMAAAGTVAVLLPGAFHTLRERQVPPVTAMRREGVAMALATDCNPGSSPVTSLLLMMNMGCLLFGLTTDEALAAVTVNAARALGLGGTCGRLVPGLAADFVLWDVTDLAELPYRLGFNPVHRAVVAGEPR